METKSSFCIRRSWEISTVVSHVAKLTRVSVFEHCEDFSYADHSIKQETLITSGQKWARNTCKKIASNYHG